MIDSNIATMTRKAIDDNFVRYPDVLGMDVWPNEENFKMRTTYDHEIAYLKTWFEKRLPALDTIFSALWDSPSCMYDDTQYASFSDPTVPMTYRDTIVAFYVKLGYLEDSVLVSKVQICADYDNDGELSFADMVKLTYIYLGYLTPPSHIG